MSVAIPPSGTRGASLPRMPGPLTSLMNAVIFGLFRNRRFMGFPILMLTTVGARSGRRRQNVLGYFSDPARPRAWIIVASAAGAARHPSWYFNLAKHPDQVWIEVGNARLQVRPTLLAGQERAEAWQRVITEAPSYAAYEKKTDRQIPLIRLEAAT
jgi:deazaflavin-dependent oxidoreductase (nitroreductase family)